MLSFTPNHSADPKGNTELEWCRCQASWLLLQLHSNWKCKFPEIFISSLGFSSIYIKASPIQETVGKSPTVCSRMQIADFCRFLHHLSCSKPVIGYFSHNWLHTVLKLHINPLLKSRRGLGTACNVCNTEFTNRVANQIPPRGRSIPPQPPGHTHSKFLSSSPEPM